MPITMNGDPPGSRILARQLGDAVEEEQIREWSLNGAWVKMRVRSNPDSDKWQRKDLVDDRMLFRLADTPPVIP